MAILAQGGNAVDAAIACNAAIAVTSPHLCGMGGDLYALIHDGIGVHALNATGRAGAGSSAAELRAQGHEQMPFRHDIRTVTVPGCVDGWSALSERFGRLSLAQVLAPAIRLADDGFPSSPLLVGVLAMEQHASNSTRSSSKRIVPVAVSDDPAQRVLCAQSLSMVATGFTSASLEMACVASAMASTANPTCRLRGVHGSRR